MAQDAGQAGARWTEEDWLLALNNLIDRTLPRETRMHTHAGVLAQVQALTTQVAALKAELSSGTVGTLTTELTEAVQANEQLTAQVEALTVERDALAGALTSARHTMTLHSRDWSLYERDAWLYGIIVGWDRQSLDALAKQFGWLPERMRHLRDMGNAVAALRVRHHAAAPADAGQEG